MFQALRRWLRFNLIGMMGFAVQAAMLTTLITWTGLPDLVAVALAVGAALSHNFLWHETLTWPGRSPEERLTRFARFQLSSGGLSLLSNIGLTKIVMLATGLPVVTANVLAVASASLLNFVLNDRVVFRAG